MARESVINLMDWSRLGVNRLCEADNCALALEIMQEHPMDIIFLDIKMPEMNGVDLLFMMQENNMDAQVIVLSGFSDFESARKMLKTGKVIEYLLKPVSEDLAAEAVAKAVVNIEKKRELAIMKGMLDKVIEKERKRLCQSYIFGYVYEPDTSYDLGGFPYETMQAAVVYCEDEQAVKDLCQDMAAYKISNLIYVFSCEQPHYFALLFASGEKNIDPVTHNICSYLCEKTKCHCGIGRQTASILDLNTSFRQAFFACESRLLIKKNIVDMDDINDQLKTMIDRGDLINKMTHYVRTNDTQKIDELIKLILKSFFFEGAKDPASKFYDLGIAKAYFANFLESMMPEIKNNYNLSYIFSAKNMNELFFYHTKCALPDCPIL